MHAWRNLSPCGPDQGLASMLRNASHLLAGPYFSAGLRLHRCVPICEHAACTPQSGSIGQHACRQGHSWEAHLSLDVVLHSQLHDVSLRSLLGTSWPPGCPAARTSVSVLVAADHTKQPSQSAWSMTPRTRDDTPSSAWLTYSAPDSGGAVRPQPQPQWRLAPASPLNSPSISVQQYIAGQQGVHGTLVIHISQPAQGLQGRASAPASTHCLMQAVPWQMQLDELGLGLELHLQVLVWR